MRTRAILLLFPVLVVAAAWGVVAKGYEEARRPARSAPSERSRSETSSTDQTSAPETGAETESSSTPAQTGAASAVPGLLFHRDGSLYRLSGNAKPGLVADLGTEDVFPSPDGAHFAALRGEVTSDGDFASAPHLQVLDATGAVVAEPGPGYSPVWSHDGGRIAYLGTDGGRECVAEVCEAVSRVRVASLSGDSAAYSKSGSWTILGWLGERVIAADSRGRVLLLGEGTRSRLPGIAPVEVWGGSPDGRYLIVVDDAVRAVEMGANGPTGNSVIIGTGGRPLAEGAWLPDGRLVAVAVEATLTRVRSELVTVALTSGSVAPVPGSTGAMGPPHVASGAVTFISARRGAVLTVRSCSLGDEACSTLMRAADEVTIQAVS